MKLQWMICWRDSVQRSGSGQEASKTYKNNLPMKSKVAIALAGFILAGSLAHAQDRYFTKTGTISFFASTDLENVEATNKIVTAVLDIKSGAIQFSAPMKAFE